MPTAPHTSKQATGVRKSHNSNKGGQTYNDHNRQSIPTPNRSKHKPLAWVLYNILKLSSPYMCTACRGCSYYYEVISVAAERLVCECLCACQVPTASTKHQNHHWGAVDKQTDNRTSHTLLRWCGIDLA